MKWVRLATFLIGFSICADRAVADLITAAVTSNTADFKPASLIADGSGLSGDPNGPGGDLVTHGAWPDNNSWATASASTGDYYADVLAGTLPIPVLTFDFGEDFEIGGFSYWAYTGRSQFNGEGNSAKDINMLFATESDGLGGFGTTIPDNPAFNLAMSQDFGASTRQDFSLPVTLTARYVQVTITDNHRFTSGPNAGGNRVGMGELQFDAFIIPEPSSLALLGVTALGIALFPRRYR